MRNAFVKTLIEEARQNPSIWLLCGDVGFSVLEGFASEFPERFINVGIAEQNMIGIAAGLALSGKTVFTYTIGNFSFMRCLEQIRNDVCYHNLNVKVVALAGGFAYGAMGYTHHVIEDIAMMRVLPNITVSAPNDPIETALVTKSLCNTSGPAYLRIGRGGEPIIHSSIPEFEFGKAIVMLEGRDVTIISSAGTLDIATKAREELISSGSLSVGIISVPVLVPFDVDTLLAATNKTKLIITVEEHGNGGLASIVAECFVENAIHTPLKRIFVKSPLLKQSGDKAWLRELHELTTGFITMIAV